MSSGGSFQRALPPGPRSLCLKQVLCCQVRTANSVSSYAGLGEGNALDLAQHRSEKQPYTDGGAAGCTVVGPPGSGEIGRIHSEVALTTFLSWQSCPLSSSLVQANGFAAASFSHT